MGLFRFLGVLTLVFKSSFGFASYSLAPFGLVEELLKKESPWSGFSADEAVLTVVRIHQFPSDDCEKWVANLLAEKPGTHWAPALQTLPSDEALGKIWEPWASDDKDDIASCDELPCLVKLNKQEVSQLAGGSSPTRFKTYLHVLSTRVQNYSNSQERKGYEFPGIPVDPWKILEQRGFKSTLPLPKESSFQARKLDFAPGKVRSIRQVLDRREVKAPSGKEATVWIRDAYTDHYFDSWGEWFNISCNPKDKQGVLIQALLVELDLLKKRDIFSQLMHGKMRSVIEKNGGEYLDQIYEKIKPRDLKTK